MSTPTLRRRQVVRGLAWATPVITMVSAAPAMAASCSDPRGCPTVSNHGHVSIYVGSQSAACPGGKQIIIDGTASANVSNPGIIYQGTNATTEISGVSVTYYFAYGGMSFTSNVAGWSNLAATGKTVTNNGTTYYEYSSTYLGGGPVPATDPSTTLPYKFTSGCFDDTNKPTASQLLFDAQSSSAVNGQTLATDSGFVNITLNA